MANGGCTAAPPLPINDQPLPLWVFGAWRETKSHAPQPSVICPLSAHQQSVLSGPAAFMKSWTPFPPFSRVLVISSSDYIVPPMNKRDRIIRKLHESRQELGEMGVLNLWLFGSLARGDVKVDDADFIVEFVSRPTLTGFMNLKFFLEERLQMPVDLHTRASCPDRFMRRIEPELLHVA